MLKENMPLNIPSNKPMRVKNDTEQSVELGWKWKGDEKEYKQIINSGISHIMPGVSEISSIKEIETPENEIETPD